MRILVDYRPALRERTGVGEYVHELVRAYTREPDASRDEVSLFTSSWKDRPSAAATELPVRIVDRRIPVAALHYLWHRLEWPPVERLAGPIDVVHSGHPLLIPAESAAQVVTIHDLFFLSHPERTRAEIRRDYPVLAASHARRADAIITSSDHTRTLIVRKLGVDPARVHLCPPGAPDWKTLGRAPNLPAGGYILFIGTLEPRKNLGVLLDAYARLVEARGGRVPRLVIAGRATDGASEWVERMHRAPLSGLVDHRGYVALSDREQLFAGARLLVLPSLDEGFGLPVLEAMSAGVPVVASTGGSLPEVIGDAGALVDPHDVEAFARAIARMLDEEPHARACAERGLERAREFSWSRTAAAVRRAYADALAHRLRRGNGRSD